MRVVKGIIIGCVLVLNTTQADMLGARVGLDYGQMKPSVTAGNTGQAGALALEDSKELTWFGRFEHPLPLLPNIATRYQHLTFSAIAPVGQSLMLDNAVVPAGADIEQFNAQKTVDITGYYEVLDNPVLSLDLGLTARLLRTDVRLGTGATAVSRDSSVVLPMLFVDAELGLWRTDTHWFLTGNYSQYQSDRNVDWRSGIAWRFIDIAMFQAHLRGGWQYSQSSITNRDQLDFYGKNEGAFIGLDVDF